MQRRFPDITPEWNTASGTLNDYDLENLERLYLYQIAVCDDYGQYYASAAANRHIYLRQARHATRLLQSAF